MAGGSNEKRLDMIFEEVVPHAPSNRRPVGVEGAGVRFTNLRSNLESNMDELSELKVVF